MRGGELTPTHEDLARELAERNDRCGHVDNARICLRPKDHTGEHAYESIDRVIPF